MEIISGSQNIVRPLPYPIITIGNFDGVHLGHQSIFRQVVERARKKSGTSVVFTFEPHPVKVLAPGKSPHLLTSFQRKAKLIAECEIDHVVYEEFNRQLAGMTAEDFVITLLVDRLHAREIMVGSGFVFGRGRAGTVSTLSRMGKKLGFTVHTIKPVEARGEVVSSSRIRALLEAGKVEEAAELLGRPYSLSGTVIAGHQMGKDIGIPTANIEHDPALAPPRGVYAVRVFFEGMEHHGVVNVGFNPTFNRDRLSVEVHIFNFNQKTYGKEIQINFIRHIRNEMRFPSADALVQQIKGDIQAAKNLFAEYRA
ncbi:MAG: bifunctional riboflavin kinase/FAD synthetase [Nitrospinota bacterium]|nr:bifunctional riboflavin kinase/FAD synthetase [Nitrospinota bacterium]